MSCYDKTTSGRSQADTFASFQHYFLVLLILSNISDALVRKSFERAGTALKEDSLDVATFNFLSYVHFKAYNDVLVERSANFNQFRKRFEPQLGERLLAILLGSQRTSGNKDGSSGNIDSVNSDSVSLRRRLDSTLVRLDILGDALLASGVVALVERTGPDTEKISDWSEDMSDLQFTVALDKDASQDAQILLQEQGYRLHPDYSRFAIASVLRGELCLPGRGGKQDVTVEEYYMDTSYSSDPDKFEVKQVLLNVVIESA